MAAVDADAGGARFAATDVARLAKDGMDLPTDQITVAPSTVQMANGQTYDFEFVSAGELDIEVVVGTSGDLLGSMKINVR